MTRMQRILAVTGLVLLVGLTVACGGDDDSESGSGNPTVEEVIAAYSEAGGVEFAETTSLVDGAIAVGPPLLEPGDEMTELNDALGVDSLLFQVYVFDGTDPPTGEEAAREAAFASDAFEDAGDGVFVGDNDIAYYGVKNLVVTGPVGTDGVDSDTLTRWREVADGL